MRENRNVTMPRRRFLDHRVPPPVVAGVVVLLMALAERSSPHLSLEFPGRNALAWVLASAGMVIAVAGILSFRRLGTTVNPLKPHAATSLAVTGIYRRTRNPMYLGVTFILLGLGCGLGHPASIALVALFPLFVQRFQIEPEERALAGLFGSAYDEYRAQVRRWL